jgi:hypothetical protein
MFCSVSRLIAAEESAESSIHFLDLRLAKVIIFHFLIIETKVLQAAALMNRPLHFRK